MSLNSVENVSLYIQCLWWLHLQKQEQLYLLWYLKHAVKYSSVFFSKYLCNLISVRSSAFPATFLWQFCFCFLTFISWVIQDRSLCPCRQRGQNGCRLWQYIQWVVHGRSCHNLWNRSYFVMQLERQIPLCSLAQRLMVNSMLATQMFCLGYCAKEKNQKRDKASLLIIRMFYKN